MQNPEGRAEGDLKEKCVGREGKNLCNWLQVELKDAKAALEWSFLGNYSEANRKTLLEPQREKQHNPDQKATPNLSEEKIDLGRLIKAKQKAKKIYFWLCNFQNPISLSFWLDKCAANVPSDLNK